MVFSTRTVCVHPFYTLWNEAFYRFKGDSGESFLPWPFLPLKFFMWIFFDLKKCVCPFKSHLLTSTSLHCLSLPFPYIWFMPGPFTKGLPWQVHVWSSRRVPRWFSNPFSARQFFRAPWVMIEPFRPLLLAWSAIYFVWLGWPWGLLLVVHAWAICHFLLRFWVWIPQSYLYQSFYWRIHLHFFCLRMYYHNFYWRINPVSSLFFYLPQL